MKTANWIAIVLGAALALPIAPAVAGNSPRGDCALKNKKQREEAYAACNAKHGTTVTPDRSACFRKADSDWRETEKKCTKLSDVPSK